MHDQKQNRLAIDKATGDYNFACPCNDFAEYSARAKNRVRFFTDYVISRLRIPTH